MRVHIGNKASFLILMLFSCFASAATYTKTISMPPTATVMSSGTPNMAANILEVGMSGVEYIPSTASESRAVANISKGLRIPSSGVLNVLKGGLKANLPSLLATGAVAGIVAGLDWVMKDGVLVKQGSGTDPVPTTGTGFYQWTGAKGSATSSAQDGCFSLLAESGAVAPWGDRAGKRMTGFTDPSHARCEAYVIKDGTFLAGATSVRSGSGCPQNATYNANVGACMGSAFLPLSDSDYDVLDGFVQGKDGTWMRGLADDVCNTSSDYEACIANMGAKPYVSGPLSVSSPEVTTSTTSTNADGSSTEVSTKTKTDYSLGYPSSTPGSITVDPKTTTTTTTTTRDPAGNTTGTNTTTGETTTTQPGSGTEIADGTFTDTPFPKVDPFYTQKFPGGFKDVWNNNKAAFDASPFISFLHSFVPSFSGSCPSWAMSFDIMPYAHFGSRQFSSLCSIFAVIKVIMLVTAMFTCRAIIFGG